MKYPRVAAQPAHGGVRLDPDVLIPPRLPCIQSSPGGRLGVKHLPALHPLLLPGEIETWEEKYPAKGDTAAGGRGRDWNPLLAGSKAVLLQTMRYSHPAQPSHLCWKPVICSRHRLAHV